LLFLGILGIADPDQCLLQKTDDCGQDFLVGQSVSFHVSGDALSKPRHRGRELDDMLILVLVAELPPLRMVAISLATPRIEPCCLDVAVRRWADPHGLVGRRDAD